MLRDALVVEEGSKATARGEKGEASETGKQQSHRSETMRRSWARQRGITESETSGIKSKMSGVSELNWYGSIAGYRPCAGEKNRGDGPEHKNAST